MLVVRGESEFGVGADVRISSKALVSVACPQTPALPRKQRSPDNRHWAWRRDAAWRRLGATQPVFDALRRRRPQRVTGSAGKRTLKRSIRLGMLEGSISSA